MRAGIVTLVVAYVLSQFYRAFLAVMAPVLNADIGATPGDLSQASGLWFAVFAAMQIPVGWLLDNVGPKKTASVLFGIGAAGGAALFAVAEGPGAVKLAMALIGVGCSPVLMASYFTFARVFEPRVFGTLAGVVLGTGTFGNVVASYPMAWAVENMGWRETMWGLAVLSLVIALVMAVLVKDPPAFEHEPGQKKGSVLTLLAIPALWFIFPIQIVNYAPAAGLRGLWAGPYLEDVFGMTANGIGVVTLVMAFAMIAGNFLYGPADRLFGTRKWVIFVGNALAALCLFGLWAFPDNSVVTTTLFLAAVGLFGASFPLIMAHARAFFPPHLAGAGMTLINLMGIGGVSLFQFLSGGVYGRAKEGATDPAAPYESLFLFFAIPLLVGLAIYLFSRDRTD
ncbi:MFS transporter [Maritimibacter sp. UBA3975]|uniref:MFS transporter n=1 Tax=Maritimibacter sp. UBA3975 TaxID=1946833 RepID=UPI000C0B304E|nr:MFS transporter [Maritimibacter sp. UBA3975]MAM61967.1 MFS transporter [Maritimibacter sp.]|tara:strand:- start:77 stop:1264 length:1188 start_codon:yes stop_codon:yes gene_type:complete